VASSFDRGGKPDGIAPGILGPVPQESRPTGLTYEPFYGLKEKPFSLTSDARFFYQSRSHAPAFDNLLHAIKRRESLTVLTGDIGTGKTTLCRAVLESLDRKTFSAFVTDPFASREELLKGLLIDFGVASVEDLTTGRLRAASRTELSYLLHDFLGTLVPLQAFAVVFIDEAQNLSLPLLEEVRILSDADGQLQVVLVGQLEFREKLKLPQMRQLEQRVSVHCRLEPLDVAGVAGYISHRLHRAGGSADRVTFSGDAVEAIYELSGGVPRIINKLCDRALHLGHTRKLSTIDVDIVRSANPEAVPPPSEPVIAPVSIVESPAPALISPPAAGAAVPPANAASEAVPTASLPSAPTAVSPVPTVPSVAPRPSVAPPAAAPLPTAAPVPPPAAAAAPPAAPPMAPPVAETFARGIDSVDRWLADIADKAATAAKANKSPSQELRDPAAWRERWAPTNAVSPPEDNRRFRYRIRIGTRPLATQHEGTQSPAGWRQFVVVLVTMTVLASVAIAGPSLARASARLARYVNAQFSAPQPPEIPLSVSPPRVPLPRAPQVPDGPY
jgi:type II secretory pathway predicted ATPase ExeA